MLPPIAVTVLLATQTRSWPVLRRITRRLGGILVSCGRLSSLIFLVPWRYTGW